MRLLPVIAAMILNVATILGVAVSPARAQPPSAANTSQPLDDRQFASHGIRKLTGKHLVLVTDVPSSPEIDRLPAVFDAAVPQWAAYFGIDERKTNRWQARAYLIGDRRRFEALDLMPPGHSEFINGISLGAELWLHDQPTAYYRRHLLLHEGTHVFMASFLGGCGPGWYMEGTAELCATHRFNEQSGELALRVMPVSREEVPMLGRIKLIHDAVANDRVLSFPGVMQIDNRVQLGNESYAWCWAGAKFLDMHPRYRDRFRGLRKTVLDPKFNEIVRREFDADWSRLTAEWQAFATTLDHAYDFERMTIDFAPGEPASTGSKSRVRVAADRGWQSAGVRLDANRTYTITATGRYQIAAEQINGKTQPWPCEPGGITIEYHDGHPLGMLLGAVIPDKEFPPTAPLSFVHPSAIGLRATVKPATSGTLFLRVNDSAAKLDDNRGVISVSVELAKNAE